MAVANKLPANKSVNFVFMILFLLFSYRSEVNRKLAGGSLNDIIQKAAHMFLAHDVAIMIYTLSS